MADKAREDRLRRRARSAGVRATKSRRDGTWTFVNARTGVALSAGPLSLEEAERWLGRSGEREELDDLRARFREHERVQGV
jgi:hypothetical protein